jgi:nucleotide-binding universal stress UspA family protein
MLDRILVPLDGSPLSESVLPDVRRLLRRSDAEVILVRSEYPLLTNPYPGLVAESALGAVTSYLQGVADRLGEQGVRARTVADSGPAAEAILRAAQSERATLIALSTHGRTGAARVVMGSVAEQVLRGSPVPVLAVRMIPDLAGEFGPTDERRPFRNVLVPLDRSERALRALGPAADICRLFGARLLVLHVLESENDRETGEAYLRAVEARAASQGLAVTSLVDRGDAVEEILDVARFHDIDLVVMATHGRRGLSRLTTGSVTEGVLRRSAVPVLVTRTADSASRESVA